MGTPDLSDLFNPDYLRVSDELAPSPVSQHYPRQSGRFLKGPIPWSWLQQAIVLPGKAFHLAVLLWHLRGLTGQKPVHLCLTHAATEGIPVSTARRAVRALECAGLITVTRRPGRGLDVTILEVPPSASESHPSDSTRNGDSRKRGSTHN
jgi:hypothetical protein